MPSLPVADSVPTRDVASLTPAERAVEDALELIRPAVRDDGGDVDLVSFEAGVVTIRFRGACVGCPSSDMTLKHGIERHLVAQVQGVHEVVQVED
jgi:Fe-S cluster biogenesis protein NfuA